jgi:uncharacterized repeat protein (TIGR03803 family)
MRLSVMVLAATLFVTCATAQTFQVFYTFHFTDGAYPNGELIQDTAGNLYGTAQLGGTSARGVVYKLSSAGEQTILYNFTGVLDGHPLAAIPRAVAARYSNLPQTAS